MGEKLRIVGFVTFLIAACGTGDQPQQDPVAAKGQASVQSQGRWLQGRWLQGTQLQGVHFQGVQVGGVPVSDVQLQGTVLSGQAGSATLSGTDFIGATLVGVDAAGNGIELTIGDIQPDPSDPSGEILLYTLLSQDPSSLSVQNLCGPDQSGAQQAIPVAGVWDVSGAHTSSSSDFTFGCTNGVIAKCVRWGYKPWKSVAGQPLADFHQACTRMARADYCGDGTPHTQDGTMIDIYDVLQIQTRDPGDGMVFEAAWTPQGAYCVSKARWNLLAATLLLECPDKLVLPGLSDLLNPDSCAIKLSPGPRSGALMSNRSYLLQLAL